MTTISIERNEARVIYVSTIVKNDEVPMQQENEENELTTKKIENMISVCHRK